MRRTMPGDHAPGTQSTMRRAHSHASGHLPSHAIHLCRLLVHPGGACMRALHSAPHVPRSLVDTSPLRIHPPVACTETHSMPEQYRAPALSRFAQCVHASTPAATRTLPTPAAATQQPKGEREREREGERASTRTLGERRLSHAVVLRLFRRRRRRCPTWSMPRRRASTREQRSEICRLVPLHYVHYLTALLPPSS